MRQRSAIILQEIDQVYILTEKVLEAAAEKGWRGAAIVKNFLAKESSVVQMTSKVLEAAAKSGWGASIVVDLLERCDDRVQLTERVMESCVRCDGLDLHTGADIVMELSANGLKTFSSLTGSSSSSSRELGRK